MRDGYPEGVPCWIDSRRRDAAPLLRFYGGVFGWTFAERAPRYHTATLDGLEVAAIGEQESGTPDPPVWNTYVMVADAAAAAERGRAAGGTVAAPPFVIGDAGTTAVLTDPQGAQICVWQAAGHRGAQLVNAPGSWNWSTLATPDVDGACAFYAAVFGWEATPVEFGETTAVLFRRPGYGDELEKIEPGIRARHAAAGTPPGFTDAVAWAGPSADGPAAWGVTFSVADADAVTARAAALGGTVLAGPYDAGPAREAVLSDPDGASFTVSHYSP